MAVTQLLEPLMDTLEGIRMPTRFIHLDRMPRDGEGVAELHQALQKCQDGPLARSLAGKPLAGFRATPDRRIIVLWGMIVSVIRFKNPLLHRQSSLRKRRLGENRGFRPSF